MRSLTVSRSKATIRIACQRPDESLIGQHSRARDVRVQSPLTNALSDERVSQAVSSTHKDDLWYSRSSCALMAPDRSWSTDTNHDQSLKFHKQKRFVSRVRTLREERIE
jgi:hypothetical protein